jgi:hypothetical protein
MNERETLIADLSINAVDGFFYITQKLQVEIRELLTQKREPLSDKEIHAYLSLMEPPFLWDEGFCSGIEWAEKQHGIGGGE